MTYPEPPSPGFQLPRHGVSSGRVALQLSKTVCELPSPDDRVHGQRSLKVCPPRQVSLLTGHRPQRRVTGLLSQHSNGRICPPFVPFPSLAPTQNTITSNPFAWQNASREKWAGIQPQDLCDREGRETSAWGAHHREELALPRGPKQPNRCSLTLSWGYRSLEHRFGAKSRKNMRKIDVMIPGISAFSK